MSTVIDLDVPAPPPEPKRSNASPAPAFSPPTPAALDEDRIEALEQRLKGRELRRDGWTMVIFGFSAIALVAAVVAVGFGSRAVSESKHTARAAASAVAHLSEFKVEPTDITVAAGGTLQVMNMGSTPHNLAVKDSPLASARVPQARQEPWA